MIFTKNEPQQLGFRFLLSPPKQYATSSKFIKKICIRNSIAQEKAGIHSFK
jgi:hypothetical protein